MLDASFEQLAIGRAQRLQMQRHHAAEVGGVVRRDHRSAAWPGLERDQPVHLEDAQRLAQRSAPDSELFDHRVLGRQHGAGLEAVPLDVLQDLPRYRLGDLLGSLSHRSLQYLSRRLREAGRDKQPIC